MKCNSSTDSGSLNLKIRRILSMLQNLLYFRIRIVDNRTDFMHKPSINLAIIEFSQHWIMKCLSSLLIASKLCTKDHEEKNTLVTLCRPIGMRYNSTRIGAVVRFTTNLQVNKRPYSHIPRSFLIFIKIPNIKIKKKTASICSTILDNADKLRR